MFDLPESVQEIAEIIGREQSLYLIGQLGTCGKRSWRVNLYVPSPNRLKPDHKLVQILGWNKAMEMCKTFGGYALQPSNCRHIERRYRNRVIHEMHDEGRGLEDIADTMQLSLRQVRNILAEKPPAESMSVKRNNESVRSYC